MASTFEVDTSEVAEVVDLVWATIGDWTQDRRERLRRDMFAVPDADWIHMDTSGPEMAALVGPRILDVLRAHGVGSLLPPTGGDVEKLK